MAGRPDRADLSLGVQARGSSGSRGDGRGRSPAGDGAGDRRAPRRRRRRGRPPHDRDQPVARPLNGTPLRGLTRPRRGTVSPDDVGDHIDAATAGAVTSSPSTACSFSVAGPAAVIAPLRAPAALADARAKADALAEAEGCTVGDVIAIVEAGGATAVPMPGGGGVRARLSPPRSRSAQNRFRSGSPRPTNSSPPGPEP